MLHYLPHPAFFTVPLRSLQRYFQIFYALRSSTCFVWNAIRYLLCDFRQTGLLAFHEFFDAITQVLQ